MLKDNFIDSIIKNDLKNKRYNTIITRFPPEPNGYLHIGHIKSIVLNFSIAAKYGGCCHLRFDDTNPYTAKEEFYDNIKDTISWLGFEISAQTFYTSDYFDDLYSYGCILIQKGLAYVCFLSSQECHDTRGTLTSHGLNSPYRDQTIEDNLILFARMKDGHFEEGACTLRAKINMASGNINMRDPVLFRIKKQQPHFRTGHKWCIYPSYDFSHTISDVIERISHSLCTLEFQDHQPLYKWFLNALEFEHQPTQIEFARLAVENCLTSKRQIKHLIETGMINSFSSPLLATIEGLKNRGYTASSLKRFCENLGISKQDSIISKSVLEQTLMQELDQVVERRFIVQHPLELIIKNTHDTIVNIPNHPKKTTLGQRPVSLSSRIFIEQGDFVHHIEPGQKKVSVGSYLKLIGVPDLLYCYGYKNGTVLCEFVHLEDGSSIKPQAHIHWVNALSCCEFALTTYLNNLAKTYICKAELALQHANIGDRFQAYRIGYLYKTNDTSLILILPLKSSV